MTSVTFAKFHPNLIVGGTYSGQIVLWDNRSSKKTPVQRTPLSATAHTVSQLLKLHTVSPHTHPYKISVNYYYLKPTYEPIDVSSLSCQTLSRFL